MRIPSGAKRLQAGSRREVGVVPSPAGTAAAGDPDHFWAIQQSHERCAALGVSRIDAPDFSPIGRPDLSVALQRNRRLYDHAAPVMALLHEQIARTESMVLLTDSLGTVIHAVGDDDFLGRAEKVALRPGANWSEGAKGTNAIGTALVDETPTLVHATEHYLHANQFLTCSAAPILDPRGNMLGVLDVSGDFRSFHKHTLALVRMSARMIENRWLTEDLGHALRVHFHARPEFIGTFMEGIVAVGEDGRLLGANRSALELLSMSGAALRMQTLTSLFGTSVAALVDHCREQLATPMMLVLPGGRQFSAFARCNWPVWLASPAATKASDESPPVLQARQANGAASVGDGQALNLLRTGDAQMQSVVDKIRRVIDRDIPVLIMGETGTGKELLARAIHADSSRSRQPFVAVNCASIPDTLIEAELFGYDEGAFTGARRKGSPGKIVQANGGTLFLDEIGDMPLPLQAHLLRVLQERQVTPLGSSRALTVDLAIVCATHRNLREMIDRQAFREDLYYRLNGLAVRLPPLRERSDLMALVRRVLERQCNDRLHNLSAEVAHLFASYPWPGNVRQLYHVLRTAAVMAGSQPTITRAHLPDDFLDEAELALARAHASAAAQPVSPAAPGPVPVEATGAELPAASHALTPASSSTLEDLELEAIRRALDAEGGNISRASKRLGISRNTIYRKLRWNGTGA